MLAFVQLIAATVLTTDLGYAVLFVAFVVVTPWVMTFAHLRREIEAELPLRKRTPVAAPTSPGVVVQAHRGRAVLACGRCS